jgi:hypothetical protein
MPKKLDPKVAEKVMLKAGLKPVEPYKGSKVPWKCIHIECGEVVQPTYETIAVGRGGCRKCGNRKRVLLTMTPENVAVATMLQAGLKPLESFKGVSKKWKCLHLACGEIVYPRLTDIRRSDSRKSSGCISCGTIKRAELIRVPAKIAIQGMREAGLEPLEPYVSALSKWKCRCLNCGKIVYPMYNTVQQGNGGCKSCGYANRVDPNKYSLEEAEAIMLAVGLQPLEPYKTSTTKWKCKCLQCGKLVTPMLGTVVQDQSGCKYCAYISTGLLKRITQEHAISEMVKAGFEPMTAYEGNHTKWKNRCQNCKKISYPTLSNVANGSRCVYCTNHKVDEEDAVRIMLAANLKPLEPYKDSKTKWKCECLKCGRIVKPMYNTIQIGGGGCTNCAPVGMNLTISSYLYLITNDKLNAHKVGIGNFQEKTTKDRLHNFGKRGWTTHRVWKFNTGFDAMEIETKVLNILRKEMALPIYLTKEDMPATGGHSETVGADSITLLELEKIIKKVIKGYRNNP